MTVEYLLLLGWFSFVFWLSAAVNSYGNIYKMVILSIMATIPVFVIERLIGVLI